jgi:hypothetical protein
MEGHVKRLFGITIVWLGCGLAWVVLGSTLVARTGEADGSLSPEVHQLWGPPLEQAQPSASYPVTRTTRTTRTVTDAQGNTSLETTDQPETIDVPVPLVASDLAVDLDLEHRRRGLVWFPTYGVDFRGRYTFENPSDEARDVTIAFPLQTDNSVYDGLRITDERGHEIDATIGSEATPAVAQVEGWSRSSAYVPPAAIGTAHWRAHLAPHTRASFLVSYRTRGTSSWRYRMAQGTTRVTHFRLAMTTSFDRVDFPAGTISPTRHAVDGGHRRGTWQFESLVANQPIGVELPTRVNPGPLAMRITFFAPVGLLFFFFVVAVLGAAQKRELHPMHFFFLGCAFFAFHLLFAYLVDHLDITSSFAISAAVSVLLVVSYARLFVGWRFALRDIGLSQLVYLVLFSLTFLWEGFTGLSITVGAILTLFVMMQYTGRTAWGPKPARAPDPEAHALGDATSTMPRTF